MEQESLLVSIQIICWCPHVWVPVNSIGFFLPEMVHFFVSPGWFLHFDGRLSSWDGPFVSPDSVFLMQWTFFFLGLTVCCYGMSHRCPPARALAAIWIK